MLINDAFISTFMLKRGRGMRLSLFVYCFSPSLSCVKSQSQLKSMEVRNSNFTAFIDVFTSNTYIMVVVSDPRISTFFRQHTRNLPAFVQLNTFFEAAYLFVFFHIIIIMFCLFFEIRKCGHVNEH
jgi:hypothetical protein